MNVCPNFTMKMSNGDQLTAMPPIPHGLLHGIYACLGQRAAGELLILVTCWKDYCSKVLFYIYITSRQQAAA